MNLEQEKKDLHLILRMSGQTQDEVAKTLHTTRQNISALESELSYQERQKLLSTWLAKALLPRNVCSEHFVEPEYESDFERLKRKIFV